MLIVLKAKYAHTWNNYKGSLPRPCPIKHACSNLSLIGHTCCTHGNQCIAVQSSLMTPRAGLFRITGCICWGCNWGTVPLNCYLFLIWTLKKGMFSKIFATLSTILRPATSANCGSLGEMQNWGSVWTSSWTLQSSNTLSWLPHSLKHSFPEMWATIGHISHSRPENSLHLVFNEYFFTIL